MEKTTNTSASVDYLDFRRRSDDLVRAVRGDYVESFGRRRWDAIWATSDAVGSLAVVERALGELEESAS